MRIAEKKDINVTVVVTSSCNLKCTYCINGSGSELIDCHENSVSEWENADEIIDCLKNIAQIRNIRFIKLFGGEPMLRLDLVNEIIRRRREFSPKDNPTRIAFTTNGYYNLTKEQAKFWKNNQVIVNISLDGPHRINNAYRIAVNGKDVFDRVTKNIEVLKEVECPFAIVSVLDERILKFGYTITDLSDYISQYTYTYKVDPSYVITDHERHNDKLRDDSNISRLLVLQREYIDEVFRRIESLDIDNFIYENNIIRTISNLIYMAPKEYVCTAADFIGIFPNKKAYACYNLMKNEYLISDNIAAISSEKLDKSLKSVKDKLKINIFPQEYRDVEYFGDYCPLENNYESFAYIYRREMVNRIREHLNKIQPGTKSHLALMGYLSIGYGGSYFENYA